MSISSQQDSPRDPAGTYPWDAMRDCIGPYTNDVARHLGLSASLVQKWQRPVGEHTDTGVRSPLARLDLIIEASVALGQERYYATAPARYLHDRHLTEPLPPYSSGHAMTADMTQTAGTLESLGSLAFEDGVIDIQEWRQWASCCERLKAILLRSASTMRVNAATNWRPDERRMGA